MVNDIILKVAGKVIQNSSEVINEISKNQTGFKENHRTSDNLLTLKNVVLVSKMSFSVTL